MAAPLVAVEIAPPDAATSLRQSLLDACGRAAEERCVEQGEQTEPNIVAIVAWQDPEHARLEVALRREQRWVVRTMAFAQQDAPDERWRAVGLVIGTLANLIAHNREPTDAEPAAPATPRPAPSTPPSPPPAAPALEARPNPPDHADAPTLVPPATERIERSAWLGAALVAGSALDRGSPRMGAELDLHLLLGQRVYGLLGGAYSVSLASVSGVQTSFAEAFAGLLYTRELGRDFSATLHAEGVCERFSPSIDPGSGGATTGERWLGGARLGADLLFWGSERFGFFVGGAGKWMAGATDVRTAGKFVGTAPNLGYVVRAGTSIGFR